MVAKRSPLQPFGVLKKRPVSLANRNAAKTPGVLKRPSAVKRPAGAPKKAAKAKKASGLKAWEGRFWAEGFDVVAGTDEAGRGPWAGPVVAAAFAVLSKNDQEVRELLSTVADSKRMTALQRESAYAQLTDPKFKGRTVWAIAEASTAEIDSSDILRASLCAMSRAVRGLSVKPDCVLVDGCNRPPALLKPGECWTRGSKKQASSKMKAKESISKPDACPLAADAGGQKKADWLPRRVDAVIGGDGIVPSISAASVLAKVYRDQLMRQMDTQYPMYGFSDHKGYGTAAHQKAIKRYGVSVQHRRSFAPIAKVLLKRPSMVEAAKPSK